MTKILENIESQARRLPIKERARLARRLIATLEKENDGDVEQQWLDEAERRLTDYDSRETVAWPADDILSEIEAKHK